MPEKLAGPCKEEVFKMQLDVRLGISLLQL
jgi:hypothetical protein